MIRFSFSLDKIDSKLVSEFTAYYYVDGLLRLDSDTGRVFEEESVPLVELALWLSHWLASNKTARSFMPEGYQEDYGPLFYLTPAEGTQYRLLYGYGAPTASVTAELVEWETAFAQFLEDLRQAVQRQYHLQLNAVLHRLGPAPVRSPSKPFFRFFRSLFR